MPPTSVSIFSKLETFGAKPLVTAASNWAYRLLNAGTQLLCVRFFVGTIGAEKYGVIALLAGLAPILAVTDLGLGNALLNGLAAARAGGENAAALGRRYLKIGHLVAIGIVLVITLLSLSAGPWLLRSAGFLSSREKILLFAIAGGFYVHQAIIQMLLKLYYSERIGPLANALLALGSLGTISGAWLYTSFGKPSLLGALVVLNLPQSLVGLIMAAFALRRFNRTGNPAPKGADLRTLIAKSFNFWLIAFGAMLMSRVEVLVLSQAISDPTEATRYRLLSNLCMFVFILFTSMQQATIPHLAQEAAAKNLAECERIARHLIMRSLGLTVFAIAGIIIFKSLVLGFLSPRAPIQIESSLFVMFGVYLLVRIWCDTLSCLLMTANCFRPILWATLPAVLIGPVCQLALCRYFGLMGLIIGITLPYLLTQAFPLWIAWRRLKRSVLLKPSLS